MIENYDQILRPLKYYQTTSSFRNIYNKEKATRKMNPVEVQGQIQESEYDVSQYQESKPIKRRNISSTRYSNPSKSKYNYQDESGSYSSTFKGDLKSTSSRRKEQNKESAKKCRIRKKEKQYELIQKQKELEVELNDLKAENSKAKFELEKYISSCSMPSVFNKQAGKEAYQRLDRIIESQEVIDEDQITLIIDNLRNKVGVKGTERQGKNTYIFKQIIHMCFPALHRYFMWTANSKIHYFGQFPTDGFWVTDLHSVLSLTEEQKEIIKQKQHIFQKHYQTFSDLINEMKSTKTKLEYESQKLEQQIMELRDILSPIQSAKLVTFIEKNKYKEEMEHWCKRNIRKFSNQISFDMSGNLNLNRGLNLNQNLNSNLTHKANSNLNYSPPVEDPGINKMYKLDI